jgi:valyl-tRNA synthetase
MKCQDGQHDFVEITRHDWLNETEQVVRWCKYCGSIVVDLDIDNRTYPGYYMKIRNPEVIKR